MRKSLVVGILRESKPGEARAPLTPTDVTWLKNRRISLEVESSAQRIYSDSEYERHGAKIVKKFDKASLLVGIKEPSINNICKNKVYMVFSHTIKGQKENMPLLKECLSKGVTLIDFERITDLYGRRLVFFGRFAGICGTVNSLYYYGKKLEREGIENPFSQLRPAFKYGSFLKAKNDLAVIGDRISKKGIDKRLSPFIIGITGHGNVSKGVNEALEPLHPIEIHPRDIERFRQHQRHIRNRVYKIVFYREEKLRSKSGRGFYFEEYLSHPERFESNMAHYLPHLNILLHGSYWDKKYPRLVTKNMVKKIYDKNFKLKLIGDISCDINGSIEMTHKTTTIDSPTLTYNPKTGKTVDGYESDGITILSRDNLPTELAKDASRDFGLLVREYLYQLAAHGVKDITNHVAIPREVRQAVIVEKKKLTKSYSYLSRYI